jgi:uncharacterized membrane protein YcaP (DUF421 family)
MCRMPGKCGSGGRQVWCRFVEGRPQVLIHNGKVYRDIMEHERVTQDELEAAIRRGGCASIDDVHFAILENNGQISVRLKN